MVEKTEKICYDFGSVSFTNSGLEMQSIRRSYKGTPVLKQDISDGSMSVCNTIFLSSTSKDIETVKHEWGHTVQQSLMGTPKFMTRIAVPSRIGAGLDVDDYYSQPWERSADFFGGSTHKYSENSGLWAGLYFVIP